MSPLALALVLSCLDPEPSSSGPNHGGSLLIAQMTEAEYTLDGSIPDRGMDLPRCGDATTRYDGIEPIVLAVFAAFPAGARPRLSAVAFGWIYDESVLSIVDWGPYANFEIATEGWPASGQGTAVSWGTVDAQTSGLIGVYWAAAYDYDRTPTVLRLVRSPLGKGDFVDDSIPAVSDAIAAFGSFGFFESGSLPCPPELFAGVCCLGGTCSFMPRKESCEQMEGTFVPGGECDPDPCAGAPSVVESWGGVGERFEN